MATEQERNGYIDGRDVAFIPRPWTADTDKSFIVRKPHEMPFAEFAESVRPSGAVNRLPQLGSGKEVLTYSVYLNGDVAKELKPRAQEQQFQEVMLHSLTDGLGLDRESLRDNLTAVLDASVERDADNNVKILPDRVIADYEAVNSGMSHPWLQGELLKQQAISRNLAPALREAESVLGVAVTDRAPDEISRGKIVSSNDDYTVQALRSGKVVTHENRRLEAVPVVGKDVTVTYYRGNGQVFDNVERVKVSDPFIEPKSQDLAVELRDEKGELKQMLLFSGVSSFAKFVEAQQLDSALTQRAVEVRAETPKRPVQVETSERKSLTGIYIDPATNGLAFDYVERGQRNTMIFGSAEAVRDNAKTFGITDAGIRQAQVLEASRGQQAEAKRALARDEVRTNGPAQVMDEARRHAAQHFPNSPEARAQFLRAVEERTGYGRGANKDAQPVKVAEPVKSRNDDQLER